MGVISWRELTRYFADAYCDAAQAGAEMRAATDALETLRDTVLSIQSGTSIMDAWAAFDRQVGLADQERLMPFLIRLRDTFAQIATDREVFLLQRAFKDDRLSGWSKWLESYANAFSHNGWRTLFGSRIAQNGLRYSPSAEWPVERIREVAELVSKSRWPETYDWFVFLSKQEISPQARVQMLATSAEIQLYHFYQPTKAKMLLEEANEISPDNLRLQIVWGEYWMYKENYEQARKYFQRGIDKMPDIPDGFVNMGDYYNKLGEPTRAEDLYQQATVSAPGAADGYRRLLNFYGDTGRLEEAEDRLASLLIRVLALDEDQPYTFVTMGMIYKECSRYEQAIEYFDQAIELDPNSALAHVWKGYTYLDIFKKNPLDSDNIGLARSSFERTAEIAPGTIDGIWGIMSLEMQLKDWQAALDACNRCFGIHPEWESFVLAGRADIYRELERYEDALADLQKSLEIEPDNPIAISFLSTLAESYKSSGKKELSLRSLAILRQHNGEDYEDTYQNLIGNMHYYFSEYADAAICYRLAITANPNDDILHSNLARALDNQRTPDSRLEELDEALTHLRLSVELNPTEPDYSTRLHALESESQFIRLYGEEARNLTPVVPGIRIRVSENLLTDILSEDQTDLSENTRQAISEMRQHILDIMGIELPGILYSYLDSEYSQSGKYEIYFQETYQAFGYVEPGMVFAQVGGENGDSAYPYDTPSGHWINDQDEIDEQDRASYTEFYTASEYILNHLEKLAADDHHDLLGYQDMVNLLSVCNDETVKELSRSHEELLRYSQVLRLLLDKKISLKNIQQISQEYINLRQEDQSISELANFLVDKVATETTEM